MREAILDVTAELAAEVGERALTMSEIASRTGIGRATLYKYYGDVESILAAWHERMIGQHLDQLREAITDEDDPHRQLTLAARRHAETIQQHHGANTLILQPASSAEQAATVAEGTAQLVGLFTDLARAAKAADPDSVPVPPAEFANYLIHALAAAATTTSRPALTRLVELTVPATSSP